MDEYLFGLKLTYQEYTNLKRAGQIIRDSPDFNIGIKIDPDDLLPLELQENVRMFLLNSLSILTKLRPAKRTH